jgi:hypothetical protein
MAAPIDSLQPELPPGLGLVRMPIVEATRESLHGYGRLVDHPGDCHVEIVRWPAQGTRPIDADTGDQGGTTEGVFVSEWQGDILYGRNEAVVTPDRVVCFRFDGRRGLYIHPNIWHEGVFGLGGTQRSSTGRARSTRASRWTSRASSAACSKPCCRVPEAPLARA